MTVVSLAQMMESGGGSLLGIKTLSVEPENGSLYLYFSEWSSYHRLELPS